MDQFQSFEINIQHEQNSRASDKQIQSEVQKISNCSRRAWSLKEDNKLKYAIKQNGTNWINVASAMQNRNPSQCAQRWKRIKPYNLFSKRQPWTNNEDQQLLTLVQTHKNNWVQIAKKIPNRTSKQVRERFVNKLNPEINQQPFTEAEDKLIVEGFKTFGSKWCKISKMLKGRPENIIKNRFYSYLRKHYLQIDNPYYIIPQQNLESSEQYQKKNKQKIEKSLQKMNKHKKEKKIKITQEPTEEGQDKMINTIQSKNEFVPKDIQKQQDIEQIQIKVETMISQSSDIQKQNENFQDCNLLQSIKEEPKENNYQALLQNKKDENSQANFSTNSFVQNPTLLFNNIYYYIPQIGLPYIPQYFLATPIIQYGVSSQETLFQKPLEMQYTNSN
ncbi:unnamed protein product [Paramecium sonneborni]|uniref:Homeodomain protein n=1 Tax=Paramecium sonneborni TaxID=65129 RepID=A0A8S1KEI5_9CILI|nr:unnamed protein product [Paramecium sonneborni]